MPDDSNGIYSVPAGTIVSTGDTILPSQHNPWANDSASAISNRFSKDGRAPATGNWNLNSFRITGLAAPASGGDAVNKDYSDSAAQTLTNKTLDTPQGEFLRGHLSGLSLSNSPGDTVNDIQIATGSAGSDGTTPVLMTLASALTKRLDAAWAVGSGNGGLDTGTIANTTYHVWLIRRSDTGVVDALFSASATSPTMPANYNQKAYLWPIIRSGGAILGFKQVGNTFTLDAGVTERNSASAFAEALFTLTAVPTGVSVSPMLMYRHIQGTAGNATAFIASATKTLDAADQVAYTAAAAEGHTARVDNTFTNTSAQVKFAVTITSGTLTAGVLVTRGWIYPR